MVEGLQLEVLADHIVFLVHLEGNQVHLDSFRIGKIHAEHLHFVEGSPYGESARH